MPTGTRVKVVDAPVIAAYVFREPNEDLMAEWLEGEALAAPPLLRFEISNVCLTKMRRNPGHDAELLEMFGVFLNIPISFMQVDHRETVDLALSAGLSGYDASYLWLARSLDAELITLDRRLAAAAAALR